MIKDYNELRMRKDLDLRFEEYKQDWKYKGEIVEGSFIPEVELYESEIDLLLRMCDHANTLNQFQPENQKEIESLKKLLTNKKEAFASVNKIRSACPVEESSKKSFNVKIKAKVVTRYTELEHEKQLDTILFILSESRKELIVQGRLKGQVSLF